MLDTVIKSLELLLSALHAVSETSTPHKKREKLAKALHLVYSDIEVIVSRGREWLVMYEKNDRGYEDDPNGRGRAILLLTQQLGALQSLIEHLEEGAVTDILQLHLPNLTDSLRFAVGMKQSRVWVRLDLFVSDGVELTDDEWMANLEKRMGESDDLRDQFDRMQLQRRRSEVVSLMEVERYHPERFERVNLIGSSNEIQQGCVVLNKLEAVGQQLRTFLLDKFKIEDVL